MTTIAKVRYRDYVGPWTIAIKFLSIEFSGDDNHTHANLWRDIELNVSHKKMNEEESLKESKILLEQKYKNTQNEISQTKNELSKYNPWYKRIFGEKYQHAKVPTLKQKLMTLNKQQSDLYHKIEDLEREIENFKFSDSVYELQRKKDDFLLDHGFTLVSTTHQESNDITVEMWQKITERGQTWI